MKAKAETFNQPAAIRSNCNNIFEHALSHDLKYFNYKPQNMERAADYVIDVIKESYPNLDIPYHSRWRHLPSQPDDLKTAVELAIISVLLDAGAGMTWKYVDPNSNKVYTKSEGLAMASYNMFLDGVFSSTGTQSVDKDGLADFNEEKMIAGFQVTSDNPLVGISGRVKLLNSLGNCITSKRLGDIVDEWSSKKTISISDVFLTILETISPIWPSDMGDLWPHTLNKSDNNPEGLIPFHKLTQWLTYSLVEPLEASGIVVTDVDQLTGLPEYRNGGLFVDLGVLVPRETKFFDTEYTAGDEFIVEWRAMTVILLDEIAEIIRKKLSLTKEELPLLKILQGGTWTAGRKIAKELREDGGPPFIIKSDGTVF